MSYGGRSGRAGMHYARCLKCNKIIKCSQYSIHCVMQHIRDEHPEVEIVDDEELYEEDEETERGRRRAFRHVAASVPVIPRAASGESVTDESTGHTKSNDGDVMESPKHLVFTPVRSVSIDKASPTACSDSKFVTAFNLYRTSVEQWRPADGCLFCPKCHACKRPIIKTRGQRFTENSLIASCIMLCWPCCFCIFPPKNTNYHLYCASCNVFLGVYNRDTNCFNPSREFLESENQLQEKQLQEPELHETPPKIIKRPVKVKCAKH